MNFTREPIIETIISPRDGYKLCIKNSKIQSVEEFFVDAIEVVSFGQSLFYRGQEKPKPFLVPVSDYEIFEVKDTRVVLKNIGHEKNIKIGGGREASLKPSKETFKEPVVSLEKEEVDEEKEDLVPSAENPSVEGKNDRKRDRRRSRRRRLAEEKRIMQEKERFKEGADESVEEGNSSSEVEEKTTPVTFTHLLPPPTVLISERLNQLKNKELSETSTPIVVEEDPKSVEGDKSDEQEQVPSKIVTEENEGFPF